MWHEGILFAHTFFFSNTSNKLHAFLGVCDFAGSSVALSRFLVPFVGQACVALKYLAIVETEKIMLVYNKLLRSSILFFSKSEQRIMR